LHWETAMPIPQLHQSGEHENAEQDDQYRRVKWTPKTGQSNKLLLAVQERGNHAKETEVPPGVGEGSSGAGGGQG
jgi:hypothetical protein